MNPIRRLILVLPLQNLMHFPSRTYYDSLREVFPIIRTFEKQDTGSLRAGRPVVGSSVSAYSLEMVKGVCTKRFFLVESLGMIGSASLRFVGTAVRPFPLAFLGCFLAILFFSVRIRYIRVQECKHDNIWDRIL